MTSQTTERDKALIKSDEDTQISDNDNMSSLSVFSQEHMASFSDAVFSHAELAKSQCLKSDERDEALAEGLSRTSRKRKATSAVSLASLDRSTQEEATLAAAIRDPKELSILSGYKESTGLMSLSFPMKLHWMLYECELCHIANQKSITKTNENKNPKTDDGIKCSHRNIGDRLIIGWLPSGTAFKIFDQDRFVEEVMPTYFSGTFKDFEKDLSLWGFTNVPYVGGPPTRRLHFCSHPNFVRDQPNRCRAMRFGGILSKAKELEKNRTPRS